MEEFNSNLNGPVEGNNSDNLNTDNNAGGSNDSPTAKRIYKDYHSQKKFLNNKYFLWGLTGFVTIIACIAVYLLMINIGVVYDFIKSLNNVLKPVFWGMIIAYLLTPILNFVECKMITPIFDKTKAKKGEKRDKLIRGICIFITLVFALAVIFWIVYLMISQIVPSIKNIVDNLDLYVSNFQTWANKTLDNNPELRNNIIKMVGVSSENIESWINGDILSFDFMSTLVPFMNDDGSIDLNQLLPILGTVIGSLGKFIGGLWNFIIGLIISIYLLAGKEKFAGRSKKLTYVVFNRKIANNVIYAFRYTHKTFIGFFGGKIIDSVIIGILCFIGTTIMQTPYAGLISLFVGVTNIIPYFGPFIGAIPSALLIFIVDPMHPLNTLFFIIFILVLQQIDGNIIGPKILGDSTGLEGFWVIFSITLFGGFFGVVGMVIGVPIFAVIYAGIKAWARNRLKKKDLPHHTKDYVDLVRVNDEGEVEEFIPDSKKPFDKEGKNSFKIPFVQKLVDKIKAKKAEKKNK
ncbi:MAG: AI-2E family transporter [Lachnospiraceae bacterium]|nr:AI-2E family transporter [Lachnospiraceae bacterium]